MDRREATPALSCTSNALQRYLVPSHQVKLLI
jgi:hypothetical protein